MFEDFRDPLHVYSLSSDGGQSCPEIKRHGCLSKKLQRQVCPSSRTVLSLRKFVCGHDCPSIRDDYVLRLGTVMSLQRRQ